MSNDDDMKVTYIKMSNANKMKFNLFDANYYKRIQPKGLECLYTEEEVKSLNEKESKDKFLNDAKEINALIQNISKIQKNG